MGCIVKLRADGLGEATVIARLTVLEPVDKKSCLD